MVRRREMCALNTILTGMRNVVTNTSCSLGEYAYTIPDTTSSSSNFPLWIHLVEAREVFSDRVSKLVRATFLDHIVKTYVAAWNWLLWHRKLHLPELFCA